MKKLLDDFIAADRSPDRDRRTIDMDQVRRECRYTLVKQDSVKRREDEKALLPPGYDIDVDMRYTWKQGG